MKSLHITPLFAALALSLPTAMMFTSCRQDLCYDHFRRSSVALTYEQEWERDYGAAHASSWDPAHHGFDYDELRPSRPEGVTMLTYIDESEPRPTFLDVTGGDVNFNEGGKHSLLFYNNDTEYLVFSDMAKVSTTRVTASSRSRSTISQLRSMHPEERTINPPDVLYASYIDDLPEIGIHQNIPMSVNMQPLVYTYIIRYEFEHGLEHVTLARGAMAGMAEAVYLRDGVTSDESATILYDCDLTEYGAVAKVRSFGIPGFPDSYYGRSASDNDGSAARTYTLDLEVMLSNGKIKEFTFDISSDLATQPRGGVITVSGISIDDDEAMSDSGFDVKVEDWGKFEDIDLSLGVY